MRRSLIRVWYALVVAILTGLFIEQLMSFRLDSLLFWLRLLAFGIALTLSFFVFTGRPARPRIGGVYAEQLRRKDRVISELRERNGLLMQTALKQAEKTREISQHARRLEKQDK